MDELLLNELFFMMDYLKEVEEKINPLSKESAGTFICMLAEEYCKANGENMVQFFTNLLDIVNNVNEELGEY